MPFSNMLAAAGVACAVSLLLPSSPTAAQNATLPATIAKKAKERGEGRKSEVVPIENAAGSHGLMRQRLSQCMDSWDAQTHMSRREWRVACERSVNLPPAIR